MSEKPSWTKCVPHAVARTARARRLMRPIVSQGRRSKQSGPATSSAGAARKHHEHHGMAHEQGRHDEGWDIVRGAQLHVVPQALMTVGTRNTMPRWRKAWKSSSGVSAAG